MVTIKLAIMATGERDEVRRAQRFTPLLVALNRIRGPLALIDVRSDSDGGVDFAEVAFEWTARGRAFTVSSAADPATATATASVLGWGANPPVRPRIVRTDAVSPTPLDSLRKAVARARKAAPKAAIVIWSDEVLAQLDAKAQSAFRTYCRRAKVRWVSVDSGVVTLDGEPIADCNTDATAITVFNSFELTPEEMDFIEYERIHWGKLRSKESLVRAHWGLPLVRYYQRLYAIMESSAARRYDPVLVRAFDESQKPAQSRGR
ncbi:MAG: DUF3263 domain-containing protein [Microbacteriaceae bacterium]